MKHMIFGIICTSGKYGYLSVEHAQGAIDRGLSGGKKLRIYSCPRCKRFHVTRMKIEEYNAQQVQRHR